MQPGAKTQTSQIRAGSEVAMALRVSDFTVGRPGCSVRAQQHMWVQGVRGISTQQQHVQHNQGGLGRWARPGRTVALLVLRPPQDGSLLSVSLGQLAGKRHLAQRDLSAKVGAQPAEGQVVACSSQRACGHELRHSPHDTTAASHSRSSNQACPWGRSALQAASHARSTAAAPTSRERSQNQLATQPLHKRSIAGQLVGGQRLQVKRLRGLLAGGRLRRCL